MPGPTTKGKHSITITDGRPRAVWRRRAWAVAYPVILIGIGALLDSAAMQWLGGVAVFAVLVLAAIPDSGDDLTIAEARALLDRLEGRP